MAGGILLLCGCVGQAPTRLYTGHEFQFATVSPPTENLTGAWSGSWQDPVRKSSEDFTMDLKQKGNALKGDAEFSDWDRSSATVSGQISGAQISVVIRPRGNPYYIPPSSSWVGVASNGTITGTWYLHGEPGNGYGNTGPWSAKLAPAR